MDICLTSAALAKPKYRLVIENYFNKIATKDSLTSLNTAFSKEGAFITYSEKHDWFKNQFRSLHFSTGSEKEVLLFNLVIYLVVVGENSHVQIIERHQNLSEKHDCLTNSCY